MILPPPHTNSHLASTWAAGISVLFLGIGVQGALSPLRPEIQLQAAKIEIGDEVMVELFEAPAPPAETERAVASEPPPKSEPEPEPDEQEEEMQIPPVPEISPPVVVPEMVELTPPKEIIEPPKPAIPFPRPQPTRATKAREPQPRPVAASRPSAQSGPAGKPRGTGAPALFSGGGPGRYPAPSYPSSARASGAQGSVRLLVTVETSGLPGSVVISASSGHASLDSAASDHVRRRWKWPAGEVRRYIVPIRFVLQ